MLLAAPIEILLLASSLLLVLIITQIVSIVMFSLMMQRDDELRRKMVQDIQETQRLFKVEVSQILSNIKNLLK